MLPFLSHEDLQMRLNDTIGIYKGRPVLINTSPEYNLNEIKVTDLVDMSKSVLILCTDKELNVSYYNTGYMNARNMGQAVWIERAPARVTKQGLNHQNTYMNGNRVRNGTLIQPDIANMLLNNYPTYEEAFRFVTDDTLVSCAFHKNICIFKHRDGKHLLLEYQQREVAMYDPDPKVWRMLPNFKKMKSFINNDYQNKGGFVLD